MKDQRELWDNLPTGLVPSADVCTSRHRGADTSEQAFKSTPEHRRSAQREKVFQAIRRRGAEGATCEEISISLGIPYTAASPRFTELTALGWIHDSGRRRPTSHGKPARVYVEGPAPEGETR